MQKIGEDRILNKFPAGTLSLQAAKENPKTALIWSKKPRL